jgi:hypothetical protein
VDAVARKLVSRDILPDIAGLYALGQEVADEIAQVLLRPSDILTAVSVYKPRGLTRYRWRKQQDQRAATSPNLGSKTPAAIGMAIAL